MNEEGTRKFIFSFRPSDYLYALHIIFSTPTLRRVGVDFYFILLY